MKLFKGLALGVGLFLVASFGLNAQTVASKAIVTTPTNVVTTTNITVTKVTVISATANIVNFFDGWTNYPWALGTYSNGAYTNWSAVAWTNNVIFTNSLGRVQTNSYIGISNNPAAVAAGTNAYPTIGSFAVTAGEPLTVVVNWNVARQLWAYGTNSATILVEYW